MGSAEASARGEQSSKGKGRGSVDNGGRLAAFKGAKASHKADWGGCDARWIQAIVVAITTLGGACTFGTSRDGGAYSLTLMLDNNRETLWFNGDAELDAELEQVFTVLDTMR